MDLNMILKYPATQRDTGLLPHFNTVIFVQMFEMNLLKRNLVQNTALKILAALLPSCVP